MICNLVMSLDRIDENQIVAIGKQVTGDLMLNPVQPFQGVDLVD